MERINPFEFYELSKILSALASHAGNVSTARAFLSVWNAKDGLNLLLTDKPIALGVSRDAARKLRDRVEASSGGTRVPTTDWRRHPGRRLNPRRQAYQLPRLQSLMDEILLAGQC